MIYNVFGGMLNLIHPSTLSVCLFVCQTITFESFEIRSLYLHIWCFSGEYWSSLYEKVMG